MMSGFFLGILMFYVLKKICDSFITYHENTPVIICLIFILIIYCVFLCEYIIWFSSWYSVNF